GRPVADPRTGRPGNGVSERAIGTSRHPSPVACRASISEANHATVATMLRNSNQDTRPQNAQPRVAPVTPPYDADTAAALEVLGPPIGIFRVFARRPDRAHGLAGWGRYYLSRRCALSLRHRELLILRTTARCGAEYEWG